MNNIFKTIWNKSTQSWVAVSELARGYVKSSSAKQINNVGKTKLSKFSLSFIALVIAISSSDEGFANYSVDGGVINTRGKQNIAIGKNARTGDERKPTNQSVAIGSGNTNGDGAWAKGDQSIAIGGNTVAEGDSSIAIGGDDLLNASKVQTDYVDNSGMAQRGSIETAYTTLTGSSLSPRSYTKTSSKTLGVSIGIKSTAADLSLALGTFASANKTNTLAIGSGATATIANSVAIGGGATTEGSSGSKQTSTEIEGTLFSWAGGNDVLEGDIVSFGKQGFERQLKNIAPGEVSATSTDAINGSQLHSITQVLTKRSQRDVYVHVNTGDANQKSGNANTNAGQIDAKGGATGTGAVTIGINSKATENDSIALGSNATASQKNSVAIGQASTTSAVSTDSSNLMITFKNENYTNKTVNLTNGLAKTENGAVSFGSVGKERQLHNVAAGRITATSTDAINGSQLYHVATNLGFNVKNNGLSTARVNNNNVLDFLNGEYTKVTVSGTNNASIKVDVNVTSISDASNKSAEDYSASVGDGLAKTSEVVKAINNSGFTLKSSGLSHGYKITNGDSVTFNAGKNISLTQANSVITINSIESPNFTSVNLSPQTGVGVTSPTEHQAITKGYLDDQLGKFNFSVSNGSGSTNEQFTVGKSEKIDIVGDSKITTVVDKNNKKITVGLSNEIAEDVAKIDTIENNLNTAKGNIQDLTTNLNKAKDKLDNSGLTFAGDATSVSDLVKLGEKFSIVGDGTISTTASGKSLAIKIKDGGISTTLLADDAVTEDKLGEDVLNIINAKEESVEASDTAKLLGLTVTPSTVIGKGNKFTIALNETTLIRELSNGANISNPVASSPKLVTDKVLNDYLTANPIMLSADNPTTSVDADKVSLGGQLSIKGAPNSLITTSVSGSDFTLDLTKDTKDKIATIGTGVVADNNKGTVTGDVVYEAIAESGFVIEKEIKDMKSADPKQTNRSDVSAVKNNHKINFKEGTFTAVLADTEPADNRTNVTFDVVIQDIESDTSSGVASPKGGTNIVGHRDGLTTATTVANAINTAVSKAGFVLNINDDADTVGEKITPNSIVKIKQGNNVLVTRDKNAVTIKTVENPTFKDLSLKSDTNSTPLKLKSDDAGKTLTLGGGTQGSMPVTVTNLEEGAISDNSKDAINGKQLKELADKLGLTPSDSKKGFNQPSFASINDVNGLTPSTTIKHAVDNLIGTINKGLIFGGDEGTPATQFLGSKLDIKAATASIDTKFVGTNLKTSYTKNADGNGTLSIGLSENPEFKSVVFKNGNNQVTATPTADGLSFEKNTANGDNSTKLTNLADGALSPNSKDAVTGKQLYEVKTTLESGWNIGNKDGMITPIKPTNDVNFIASDSVDVVVSKIEKDGATTGANITFTAKTENIVVDHTTGAITEITDPNKLVTAQNVSQALKNAGWIATANTDTGGTLEGKASEEKVSSGDKVTFKAGKNLKIKQDGKDFTYSTSDDVEFANVTATNSIRIKDGPVLSNTGFDMATKKISNLSDGEITPLSKEAITGGQLKDLADKLGITPNGTIFTNPNFSSIKGKDGSNGATPSSFKDALDKLTEGLNRGLAFGGDKGTPNTQYLGSKFDIKATTTPIDSKFVGKNLQTSYEKNTDGNGVLSIGLSETPDFKKITLTDGNENNVQPYLTLEKDGANNGGKITGLSERDATKNSDYGTNDNANRAATEGAVKEISDRIKQSDNTSPFTYADAQGNPVVKANDGKFYPVGSINPDGSVKTGEETKKIEPENVVVKVKDKTPMPIANVRSGLGLDGKSKNDSTDGTVDNPQKISVEKAKNVVAGEDGQSGLLSKNGAELNKVATIGDLQALAQAGLDFSGNKGDVIHRPLGTKLEILGKENVIDLIGYSSENIATETKDNKLYIRFKEKPDFKGITVKESDDKPQIELTPDNGLVVKANKDDTSPVKITSSGIDAGDSKITNLVDAKIADDSKDAVTGKQLKNLADQLGVDVERTNNVFAVPTFKEKIKNADGTDVNVVAPKTFKGAIEDVISTLNRGLSFIGDIGDGTQYLGSKFAVKATTDAIVDNTKNFVGKNLKTKYSITDGNGTLSIGLSETPDFKSITLTDGANATAYLTLGKDDAGNSGKITGLTNRTTDSNDYGTGDNVGRAATEGAVKKLSDAVNLNNDSSPMTYADAISGEKLVKGKDDKFYKPADLEGATYDPNSKIYTKNGRPVTSVTDVVVKSKDLKPMTNVASGLNPDKIGKVTDQTVYEPNKGIKPEAAINLISGADGLLTITDAGKLNKVATIGDLQAAAQAGLNFKANKGTDIHRSLGSTLSILGKEGVSDADIESKYSTENVVTEIKDDKLYVKIKDIPKLKGLELNSGEADAKSISMTPDKDGTKLKLSTSTAGKDSVTLDGIADGNIADGSKEAVTGNQLKDLAKNLGVGINPDGKNFTNPTFASIKAANGTESTAPTTLKGAIDNTIEAVNRGLGFAGDEGNGNQNLGSTFNVKSTETVITKDNKNFVGKNITTRYVKDDATGNGTLSIGISERPDFKEITLSKDGDSKPFLTIGEDTDNTDKPTTGKITGLTARDLSSNGYGVGDNVGRAATEGAVKDLYDKVKSNEGSSPFEYRDEAGNKLVKVGDKYYSEKDLAGKHIVDGKIFNDPVVKKDDKYYVAGPDGKPKLGTDGQPIMTEATTATIKDKAPATASNKQLTDISNVRSGLGLDGKSETNSVDGSPAEPKAISVEKAKEVIAGKDGKSGLLTTEGAPLNKVATIGDLQAVAKSGLTFKGNNTDAEVHRPLGTTLDIKGEATESTGTSGKNVYVHADSTNNSLTVKIKETPEFKGLELKDQNTNAIKFAPSEVEDKTDPNKKNAVLTLSSGTGPNNTVKLTGISDGDISPTSKDAVNGSQVFALSRGEVPKTEDKHITITQPDGSTTVIDAKNVIVDDKGNPLLKTYNVQGQGEHIENSIISAISNMNTEGIKFFHTNDGRKQNERPQEQGLNEQDSSAGGVHSTAVGYRANAAGENGVAFGPDAVAGKILEEKEVTITERVNGKEVVTKRKVRVVEGVKNAIAIGAGARASNDNTISIGSGNQVNGKNSGAIGDPSYINADNSYAIGNNNKIETTSEKTFVLGNEVTVTTARSVFLGDAVGYVAADNKAGTTKGNAEYSEQKIGETTYKYAGGKANEVVGVVSVGNVKQDGMMETRRIQNVAPGLISDKSTDAINGSQLYAVMDSGWNLKAEEVDGTSGKVTKGKADTTKVSIGKTVKVRAGNNVEIAHNKDESIDISTSMAPTFNSLNVNPGGTVNMGGNRVQNVGNAVEAGDAVNYGQFKAEVGKLDSRLQAGIAGAVASGTLVQAFNPNESLVAVGAGTYRGKSAVALGYSRVSDNGKIIIKVTGSTNTYGDVTGGASVGYKF